MELANPAEFMASLQRNSRERIFPSRFGTKSFFTLHTLILRGSQLELPRMGEYMAMACSSCGSQQQSEFSAEMVIHFPGREGLDKPVVPVMAKIKLCFICGCSLFTVPEAEIDLLKRGAAAA
jgi:hypothetical protein